MPGGELEKVLAVFQALRAQDIDDAVREIAPTFIQHASAIGPGLDGFQQYVVGSTREELQFEVVRTIHDGAYVVAQLQAPASQSDAFAVYRFEDGLIAEHWAFFAP